MDTTRNNYPILSYCSSLLGPNSNPPLPHEFHETISTTFPYLTDPKVFTALTQVIPSNILQTQTLLNALGPRPSLDAVSSARIKMAQIEETGGGDAKEAEIYRALVRLEEMHRDHERQAKEVEERLVEVYREVAKEMEGGGEVNEEVVRVLKELESGGVLERLDLSGRNLRLLPEAFGRIRGLLVLDLSRSELEVLPDSIGGLEKLEVLDVSSNVLASLPDSIGLLHNLKILNVSGNKLRTLPESIALCSSLVELDASFNNLTFLPINIGYGLPNLERLSIQLNKIRILPASICEMKSLKYLDVHFNEIRGLPHAIGRLINLEFLNVSSNFSDFTELPETLGDLANLRELDVSNNQIRALPDSFGRLEKLTKLNLEENPLEVPPKEIVNKEAQAVREFMAKRWQEMIAEEQQRSMLKANQQQDQTGWLAWGTSLLNNFVSGASQSVSGYLGEKAPKDPYLDQLL